MMKLTEVNVGSKIFAIPTKKIEDASESMASQIDKVTNSFFHAISNKIPKIKNPVLNNLSELRIQLTPDEVVFPGEHKVFKNNPDPLSYLLSFGAEDSVIISVVCSNENKIGIYHIDNMDYLERNLKIFLKEFGNTRNSDKWKVTMVGGQWLTGSGLSSRIKSILKNDYNIMPDWNKWSWSGCSATAYGVLLNVQTTEQTTFQHTRKFTDDLNMDILQQLRKKNSAQNDLLNAKNDHLKFFESDEFSIEKNRSVIEEHSFNDVIYSVNASGIKARDHIDRFVREINKCQIETFSSSRKEKVKKINEIYQQMNLQDIVGLRIEKNRKNNSEGDTSFSTRSTDFSQKKNSIPRSEQVSDQSSRETRSTGISESREEKNKFTVINSGIFTKQKEKFTDKQHEIAEKSISELEYGRQHKSNHPMKFHRFPQSVLSKLEQDFPEVSLDKIRFYSRDLANWDGTGAGRGAWRVVSAICADEKLMIIGIFDNHEDPYKQW